MNELQLPAQVSQLIETLEGDVARKVAKAKFAFNKGLSQIMTDFGLIIPDSDGLRTTPKVQIPSDGKQYEFWIKEKYKVREGDQKAIQTVLFVLPEDDTEGYEMATIEGETILDIGEDELDEVDEIESLSKVLDFLREEFSKSKIPS